MATTTSLEQLRQRAEDLMSSSARENGPQNLDLAKMLQVGNTGSNVNLQNYFVDKNPPFIPSVQAEDCRTIPRAIRDMYSHVECDMFMGLFPDIHRAWISIDNRLFLWNYYKGEDFYVYDGLDQLIVSVGLVRPKPGMFPRDVEFLLLISTPVEIVMLQVRFLDHPQQNDLELYPTDFNIPSDNTPMRDITGTLSGRIFMGGHDGQLYEYLYEKPSVMHSLGFKRQCRKIQVPQSLIVVKWIVPGFIRALAGEPDPLVKVVVDDARGLLYTVSERGVIALHSLGKAHDELKHIDTIEKLSVLARRFAEDPSKRSACHGLSREDFKETVRVVSLQVIKPSESDGLHAIVISDQGIRFYLSTHRRKLSIMQIRGPPDPTDESRGLSKIKPSSSTNQLVSKALYESGVTLYSFVPAQDSHSNSNSSSLTAFSVDLAMREGFTEEGGNSFSATGTGLGIYSGAIPTGQQQGKSSSFPLEWKAEAYHEVVDKNILAAPPSASLSVGRVWDIVEVLDNPAVTQEESIVHDHVVHTPPSTIADGQSNNSLSLSSMSLNGNGKRPLDVAAPSSQVSSSGGGNKNTSQSQSEFCGPIKLTELATQHTLPRRTFLVLTSKGLWSLTKQRPVNKLFALLQRSESLDSTAIRDFFRMYGLDEACAMCLAIACSSTNTSDFSQLVLNDGPFASHKQEVHLGAKAANLFVQAGYGMMQGNGRSTLPAFDSTGTQDNVLGMNTPGLMNGNSATPAARGGKQTSFMLNPVIAPGSETLLHSGCYTGLCLTLARLLRPFWDWSVIVGSYSRDSPAGMAGLTQDVASTQCRWSKTQIDQIVQPLRRLQGFMEQHAPFSDIVASVSRATSLQANNGSVTKQHHHRLGLPRRDPMELERNNIRELYCLLDRSIQALLLMDVVSSDAQPLDRVLEHAMTKEQRGKLHRMTWGTFITTEEGLAIGCLLVKGLMQLPGWQEFSRVEQLVNRLHESCPMFFGQGDALQTMAVGELQSARQSEGAQRIAYLNSAKEKLRRGYQLQGLAYHQATKNIATGRNASHDSGERTANSLGLTVSSTLNNSEKSTSSEATSYWQLDLAIKSLQDYVGQLVALGDLPGAIALALHCAACYAIQPLNELPSSEQYGPLEKVRTMCYNVALEHFDTQVKTDGTGSREFEIALSDSLASDDKLWHFTLYRWLLHNRQKQRLLEVESQYIVGFLQDPIVYQNPDSSSSTLVANSNPGEHQHAEMHLLVLRDWLVRHDRYAEAAVLMRKLATLEVDGLTTLDGPVQRVAGNVKHENPTLDQRIGYFTQALTYAKASRQGAGSKSLDLDITQLQDEFDVANLQRSVYTALKETKGDSAKTELEVLEYSLVHPSTLYNEYAYAFGLWEQCIEIMKGCDYNDPQELESLLRNIMRQVVSGITEWGDNRWTEALSAKLVHLGKKFYDSRSNPQANLRFQFPFYFCVEELEDDHALIQRRILDDEYDKVVAQGSHGPHERPMEVAIRNLNLSWDPWVVSAMQQINVDFVDLYKSYCQYYSRVNSGTATIRGGGVGRNPERYDERSKLYAATALYTVISRWLSYVQSPECPVHERQDFQARIHSEPTLDSNGTEGALRDRLDQLAVMTGSLHGDNVLEEERVQLNRNIVQLSEKLMNY